MRMYISKLFQSVTIGDVTKITTMILKSAISWLVNKTFRQYHTDSFGEMSPKYLLIFFQLVVVGHLFAVLAKPHSNTLQDIEFVESAALNRTIRDLGATAVVAVIYGVGLASMSIANSNKCSAIAGCNKGYCWAWCGVSLTDGEWCYTTKSYSQSFEYVPCQYDSECDECWKCAGSCTI